MFLFRNPEVNNTKKNVTVLISLAVASKHVRLVVLVCEYVCEFPRRTAPPPPGDRRRS